MRDFNPEDDGERNATLPEAKRILYRVGVNLGDILIDGDDILGDGVNVAARLEGISEPGGGCISGAAYEQVRGRIEAEFVGLGEQALKNIAQPMRAYALTPAAIAAVKAVSPPPMSKERGSSLHWSAATAALDLSHLPDSFVISRGTAFTCKGKPLWAEALRAMREWPSDPNAVDLAMRAGAKANSGVGRKSTENDVIDLSERALARDAQNEPAGAIGDCFE
jgi:hypothetical protein